MINLQDLSRDAALFNKEKASTTSDKYRIISTEEVIKPFLDNGFKISAYSEAGYKKDSPRLGKGRHLLRLRHESLTGESVPEIVLFNSYDGQSSFKINIGIYRFICANGMVVGDNFYTGSVKHIGGSVTEQVNQIIDDSFTKFPVIMSKIGEMQNKVLTTEQKLQLSNFAFSLRQNSPYQTVSELNNLRNIAPIRSGDSSNDLYTVFNVLQEKVVRGGFEYTLNKKVDDGTDRVIQKVRKLQPIKAVTQIERVNKELFDYAMAM